MNIGHVTTVRSQMTGARTPPCRSLLRCTYLVKSDEMMMMAPMIGTMMMTPVIHLKGMVSICEDPFLEINVTAAVIADVIQRDVPDESSQRPINHDTSMSHDNTQ